MGEKLSSHLGVTWHGRGRDSDTHKATEHAVTSKMEGKVDFYPEFAPSFTKGTLRETGVLHSATAKLSTRHMVCLHFTVAPKIEPFEFRSGLQEGGRTRISCVASVGDLPIR